MRYIHGMKKNKFVSIVGLFVLFAACGSTQFDPYTPLFTPAATKTAQTANANFTGELLENAVDYAPLLVTSGTQAHMGYWSGAGNHGSLVRVLDSINVHCASSEAAPQCAIWDEGATTSNQYPAYVTMLTEHWYERGNAVDGVVTIYGEEYADPFPLTFTEADVIWGQYSQRYADMATSIAALTGQPVKSWCFVEGARANRIFYMYELPELRTLEAAGVVTVYFARTQDADWQDPDDWTVGTENAPEPAPASQVTASASYPRGISWDDF